jgi:hypothetical protein
LNIPKHLTNEHSADKHPHAGGPASYAVFFEDPERIKVELTAPVLHWYTTNRFLSGTLGTRNEALKTTNLLQS